MTQRIALIVLLVFFVRGNCKSQTLDLQPDLIYQKTEPFIYWENGLQVGDHFPSMTFRSVRNSPGDTLDLAHLHEKLVILDFWTTGCSSCVADFPRLENLQHEFGDSVQIVLVNPESIDSTYRSFAKRQKIDIPTLPMIMNDSLLSYKLFPHRFAPHGVCLDENGKIIAVIHECASINKKVLRDYFETKRLDIGTDEDINDFDVTIRDRNRMEYIDSRITSFVSLMRKVKGEHIDGGGLDDIHYIRDSASGKKVGLRFEGSSLLDIIKTLSAETLTEGPPYGSLRSTNRVIFHVKNIHSYLPDEDYEWKWNQDSCYRFVYKVPLTRSSDLFSMAMAYIEDVFQIRFGADSVITKCLVLRRTDGVDHIHTKSNARTFESSESTLGQGDLLKRYKEDLYKVTRYTVQQFLGDVIVFNKDTIPMPIVDETKYTDLVDLTLHCKLTDLNALRSELNKYGLDLKEEYIKTKMIVISDR